MISEPTKLILLEIVFWCSIAHTFLPPWDAEPFQAFPSFVKFYKVLIYVIGYAAINGRSTVYRSISTQTTGGVNESVAHVEAPPEGKKPQS